MDSLQKAYDQLKKIRESTTLSLTPTPMLRQEIVSLDGSLQKFNLRYYQCQGIYHLLVMKRMILGDGTGLGKCQLGDTLILSSEGVRPIVDLAPSDFDAASATEGFYDLDRHVEVWTGRKMARVSRFYWSGKKPTIRVTTRSGYRVEGSLVHPMRVRTSKGERWVELRDIKEGDFLCVDRSDAPFPNAEPSIVFDTSILDVRTKEYQYPESLTTELATLLGYIIAELNPEPHQEIRDLFLKVFGWSGNEASSQRDVCINVSSVGIKKFLAACEVGEELSRDKFVPSCIFRGTREAIRGFLSAFIEAEGSVDGGGVELASSSEQLIRGMQLLLLRFGVVSTLSPKVIKDNPHTYWRLTFFGDDARRFQERVGFRSNRKAEALRLGLDKPSNPNKDLVPFMENQVRNLKSLMLKATFKVGANSNRKGDTTQNKLNGTLKAFSELLDPRRDPSYQWLSKLLGIANDLGLSTSSAYDEVRQIYDRQLYYDPVVKVESSEAEVMDIEVDDPEHCYVANGLLSHNTIQVIGALCYLWPKETANKILVVCPKSAIGQWGSEIDRFTNGIRVITPTGGVEKRAEAYRDFLEAPTGPNAEKVVMIMNYHTLVRDWGHGAQPVPLDKKGKPIPGATPVAGLLDGVLGSIPNLVTIYDECTAFKNGRTKTWEICNMLSRRSHRCYGLTATLLKNNLEEGFYIYKVVQPTIFTTKTKFMDDFCYTQLQKIKGGRKVPIIVGYKNLDKFRALIDPYFLGRPKHSVSAELPKLTTRQVICELSPAEDRKYGEALEGVLELGDGEIKDYEETKTLTSIIYCQQIADSLTLIKYKDGDVVMDSFFEDNKMVVKAESAKEATLINLLTEEFDGEKMIVYTRFESHVDRLQKLLAKEGIKSVRITGKENTSEKRAAAQAAFQDLKSDTRVVIITDAGSEAINLQAAQGIIFINAPFSYGTYAQLLGRPIRIGSPHPNVYAIHLVSRRPRSGKEAKTIDDHVLTLLNKKKNLIDKIIGEAAVGALDFKKKEDGGGSLRELFNSLREDALKKG